jgi:hypothetical protein
LLSLDPAFLAASVQALRYCVELAAILCYMVLCDRTTFFGAGEKSYSRDLFFFIYGCLCFGAFAATLRRHEGAEAQKLLNREVTEEWKGWMQVLFLLYHYFNAGEQYNSIRLYIAAYVWMTGFGNFSYYYIRKDFSVTRFAQMMWRLNFLVFFVCAALGNSYMLYYINPMHTLFTLMVYATLGLYNRFNSNDTFLIFKMMAMTVITVVVWEVPGVFKALNYPFTFLLGYNDPRHPELHPLHEWEFRSGLDRYIWIVGMWYAFLHPRLNAMFERMDALAPTARWCTRAAIIAACAAIAVQYYRTVFSLGKYDYNKMHPYTSFIPLTLFIVLRNLTGTLRCHTLTLFSWLGKITLETYILQFSIWMICRQPDAQPKMLLEVIPGYPLINFGLVSMVYVGVAQRLFIITNELKRVVVPSHANRMATNLGACAMAVLAFYVAGWCSKTFFLER